ncbi:imelysin family protein [Tabrizicola sp.]|uniref:imelysin family protein n=1 Tax=Tabrizicola sp. TaxID=2005166 RepID=UPI003F2D11E3
MRALLATLMLATPAAADTAEAVNQQIRPGYAAFATAADALAGIDSCDPEALRPAFQAAYDAWLAVGHLHFGPAEEEGRSLAIHFWPDPKGLGTKAQRALLTGDPAALAPEAMAEQSVAARGFAGLERLLYPAEALPADPCPLIHATADDLARMAGELDQAWGPYGDLLLTAGQPGNTTFLSEAEARQVLLTQLATGLEFIADRRLGRPLGTFEKPRPELAEARASERSLQNVAVSLRALKGLALALSPDIPNTQAAFDQALALAETLNDPILAGAADPQGRLRIEILQQAVRATREAVIAELAPALGVNLGFNSQDGD